MEASATITDSTAQPTRRDSIASCHSNDDALDCGLFEEPEDFRPPPPKPTHAEYVWPTQADADAEAKRVLQLRLVGAHPLWGHHLWNAARVFADYLIARRNSLCQGRRVLELGAGAGLPGIVAAVEGAKHTMLTDYPDNDLLENLTINALELAPTAYGAGRLVVQGYLWGADIEQLSSVATPKGAFDLLLLSDLICNHNQHRSMLKTVRSCLLRAAGQPVPAVSSEDRELIAAVDDVNIPHDAPLPELLPLTDRETDEPQALVFFTPHRPWLTARDLRFFTLAQSDSPIYGQMRVERILERRYGPMFVNDTGSLDVRSMVHGYRITLASQDTSSA